MFFPPPKNKRKQKSDEKSIRAHVRETRCNNKEVAVNMEQSTGHFNIINYDF
jgi:hypothetical protein